jgi:hypothetical protein
MNPEWRVKCNQSSASLARQLDHPGVIHLLMPQSPLVKPRFGGGRRFPELMARMLAFNACDGTGREMCSCNAPSSWTPKASATPRPK